MSCEWIKKQGLYETTCGDVVVPDDVKVIAEKIETYFEKHPETYSTKLFLGAKTAKSEIAFCPLCGEPIIARLYPKC